MLLCLTSLVIPAAAFQNYQNQEGKEMAADILHDFEEELVQFCT
jgi:hypothetical protein